MTHESRVFLTSLTILLAAAPWTPGAASLQESSEQPQLYRELRDARLEYVGQIQGRHFAVDRFAFEFERGDLYLLTPVAGTSTGAVFLGKARVRLDPPDRVERHNLEKLVDEEFFEDELDRAIFRFSDDTGERLRELAEPGSRGNVAKASDFYRDRHKEVFEKRLVNLDARVAHDLLGGAGVDGYFLAEIDGKEHDWFTIEVEPLDREEVRVFSFDHNRNLWNTYASFHSLVEYDDVASDTEELPLRPHRPENDRWSPSARVPEVVVDLALDNNGEARGTAGLVIEALQPMAAVRLGISILLEVTDVRWAPSANLGPNGTAAHDDAEAPPEDPVRPLGDPLPFVQEKHDRRMSEDRFEPRVTIELPRIVQPGERFALQIAYEGKFVERLRAGDFFVRDTQNWYPKHPDARRSTFDLTFRVDDRYQVASGGTLVDDTVVDGTRIVRWKVDTPLRAMSFHYGQLEVVDVDLDALQIPDLNPSEMPQITIYPSKRGTGFAPGSRRRTIEDLVGSLHTYSSYFGPFPFETLQVVETPQLGGQSFGSFLLLSFRTFGGMHTGEAELFRSHETAHQWFGNDVDWESYRDQWISEGFAQYAAALYVLRGRQEEDQFRDMMDAWRYDVLGKINVGQGLGLKHYGFVPAAIRESDGNGSGALVLGTRLNTKDTPFDYRLLAYEKGAYVLHMLRMMLLDPETRDDEAFRQMMRGFVKDFRGGIANTDDFEAAVSEAFGEPMDWFFDQWVYGTEVPTYELDLDLVATNDAGSPYALRGEVRQKGVSDGFRMPVPIRFAFDDRDPIVRRVWIDEERVEIDVPLPARPSDYEFNWLYAVLAWID